MSGLNIDHGGAISVDPEALRDVASRMDGLATRFGEARSAIVRAHGLIVGTPDFSERVDTVALWASGERANELRAECEEAVIGTLLMADVYEYVELRAQADALALSDSAAADDLLLRAERLAASDDRIPQLAAMLIAGWEGDRFDGMDSQFTAGGLLTPFFSGAAALGALGRLGTIRPGMTLSGRADAVTVTPVKTSTPIAPPTSLADSFRRLPSAPGAQIRIEKYTFDGGGTKYVAYLKGTQSPTFGGSEPWDMRSNIELYGGQTSASYQATLDALHAAGARSGDEVDIVAHSQSGMIAAHLAMESEFDVQVQITAGSPVEPTLGEDQTLVQLRHTDDLVSALAGGGSPGGTGSADSFTVSRVGDPINGPQDAVAITHWMESYIDTAEMADASGDPRVEALDEFWAGLDEAETIEATEYHAVRIETVPSGDPHTYIDRLAR